MVCNLTASQWGLILNTFRIYSVWHIRWRKSRQLAKARIRTSDLPYSMTMSKKGPHSYPLGQLEAVCILL